MAQNKDSKTRKKLKSKSCFFISCFGLSSEAYDSSSAKESNNKKVDKIIRSQKFFFWARDKKSSSSSTKKNGLIQVFKINNDNKKVSAIRTLSPEHFDAQVSENPTSVVSGHRPLVHKTTNKKKLDNNQETIHGNKKNFSKQLDDNNNNNNNNKTRTSKSTSVKRTSSVSEISQNDKNSNNEVNKSTTTANNVLSHSKALPPARRQKAAANGRGDGQQTNGDEDHDDKSDDEKLVMDSFVGMSIIMITLMIMLFWGKACAILCTCAWFYYVPHFKTRNKTTNIDDSSTSRAIIDVDSEEYMKKRKVVFEGFLQRDYRNNTFRNV